MANRTVQMKAIGPIDKRNWKLERPAPYTGANPITFILARVIGEQEQYWSGTQWLDNKSKAHRFTDYNLAVSAADSAICFIYMNTGKLEQVMYL